MDDPDIVAFMTQAMSEAENMRSRYVLTQAGLRPKINSISACMNVRLYVKLILLFNKFHFSTNFLSESMVVFLDEVNTCNSMGLFKEIICDRSMNGHRIPHNIRVIAACNPYRLKKGLAAEEENMAGLVFDHFATQVNCF